VKINAQTLPFDICGFSVLRMPMPSFQARPHVNTMLASLWWIIMAGWEWKTEKLRNGTVL